MERKTKRIKVSKIAGFPTASGDRCKALAVKGYDTYTDTEESLMSALESFKGDEEIYGGCNELLPPVGKCGEYTFSYKQRGCPINPKIEGTAPALWVEAPKNDGDLRFQLRPVILSSEHDTGNEFVEIIKNVSYKVKVRRGLIRPLAITVKTTIKIEENHPLTKKWLLKRNFEKNESFISEMETIYRRGCYRKPHLGKAGLDLPCGGRLRKIIEKWIN